MKSIGRLIVLLLVGVAALSGCSAVRSMFSVGSGPAAAPADSGTDTVVSQPATPRFKLYDSWASW